MLNNLPPVIKNLVLINLLVFVLLNIPRFTQRPLPLGMESWFFLEKSDLIYPRAEAEVEGKVRYLVGNASDGYSAIPSGPEDFKPAQIVGHFFAHHELFHFIFNMMALISLGTGLEYVLTSRKFLEFYLFCGVLGGIFIAFLDPSPNPVLGASGAISGVIVSFAVYFPNEKLGFFFLPPVKSGYIALGVGVLSLIFVIRSYFGYSSGFISHFGHLAGMVSALIYFGLYKLKNQFLRKL
jgi:membrane associated rhomboid family serine protease